DGRRRRARGRPGPVPHPGGRSPVGGDPRPADRPQWCRGCAARLPGNRPVTTATASAGIQTAARLRLGATLQDAGASALAGGLAGVLALGVGSRVAMRLVALTSGRIGTGIRPDSGAVPGTFTLEGTMFLLVAGAMFGAVLGLALTFLAARWLPV